MKKIMLNEKEYYEDEGIYTPVVKETPYEEAGGNYKREIIDGAYILVPNIEEPKQNDWSSLNRYGRARKKFLFEKQNYIFRNLSIDGKILEHLKDIENQVEKFKEVEIPRMQKAWGITEELKKQDQLKWVGLMNNLRESLDEVIFKEIIYKKF